MRIVLGLSTLLSGCFFAGNYHTARTLDKGESEMGVNMSVSRWEVTDQSTGEKTAVTWPNVLPEITYHMGVADDVEVGGRAGLMGLEGDVKWRFYHENGLHLAVAPALSYQGFIISGVGARLPVIATWEIGDHLDFNAAGILSQIKYSGPEENDVAIFEGNLSSVGGALGFNLHSDSFSVRPAVEFTRYVANVEGEEFKGFNTVNVLVHIAWKIGGDKKQLNRIEQKIDALQPAPGGYPPPGSYPPPQPVYPPPVPQPAYPPQPVPPSPYPPVPTTPPAPQPVPESGMGA